MYSKLENKTKFVPNAILKSSLQTSHFSVENK